MSKRVVLLGNEAIARGIVEAGCEVAVAYPGTPSSEILPAVAKYADELGTRTAVEWGVNEKVAFEVAAAASFTGKRACAIMKQVGVNVAADALMSVAYFDLAGGFVLVAADDPGPHSSQTEQDSRGFAQFAKIPCFDPSSAVEAKHMVFDAFDLSEQYHIPVILEELRSCQTIILHQAQHPNDGCGIDRPFGILIVEAYITTGDRGIKCSTGVAHAPDTFCKSVVHFRLIRIAKIQAIGDSNGLRAAADHVSGRLSDCCFCTFIRIQIAIPAITICGRGDGFIGSANADDGCITTWFHSGSDLHHVIILLENGMLGSDVW